jgi:hypothetical protein
VEYICHRLTTLASTQSGIDVLRKDDAMRQQLRFSARDWSGLLRLLLGPRSKKEATGADPARLGIFARLLLGDRTEDLLADHQLAAVSRKFTRGRPHEREVPADGQPVAQFPIDDIVLGRSFRRELGDLSDLTASIQTLGLCPIVILRRGPHLRQAPPGSDAAARACDRPGVDRI